MLQTTYTTYLQSCVVYSFEWNTRIRSFALVFLQWPFEERGGSSGRWHNPRTSRHPSSLWRDLESSHSELVVLSPSDAIDACEEKDQNNQVNSPWIQQKALATRNWHKDGSFAEMINSDQGEETEERTLATSSAIFTNGSNFFIRALNDVKSFCWSDKVSEILVKVSDTLKMRGCESFGADAWVCSSASPATTDVDPCVIRIDSLAGLGLFFLSTRDRTKSKLSSFQHWYDHPTARWYLPSFGCNCWSSSRCPSSISILPRHLPPARLKKLSCNMVMMNFDELSNKGLQNVS